MNKMSHNENRSTLLGFLAVIGLIVLTGFFLIPRSNTPGHMAKKARAKTDVKQLQCAFRAVLEDFKTFSLAKLNANGKPQDMTPELVKYLNGANPRKVIYMEFDPKSLDSQGGFVDPWRERYRVMFGDQDALVVDGGEVVPRQVATWSKGPDRQGGTTNDNITSWR
jgi:hypothetical protein